MKKTILVFPNTSSMVDFLLIYRVKGVETDSVNLIIHGRMDERVVAAAVTEYGAEIKRQVSAAKM